MVRVTEKNGGHTQPWERGTVLLSGCIRDDVGVAVLRLGALRPVGGTANIVNGPGLLKVGKPVAGPVEGKKGVGLPELAADAN